MNEWMNIYCGTSSILTLICTEYKVSFSIETIFNLFKTRFYSLILVTIIFK